MGRTAPQAKLHFAVCVASPARRENETIRKNPIPRDLLQQGSRNTLSSVRGW